MKPFEPVAIVGVGGLFPGSTDLEGFWQTVLQARDVAREAPAQRWLLKPDSIRDARIGAPDKVYSTRACFLDPFDFELPDLIRDSVSFGERDEEHKIAIEICRRAFRDARWEGIDRTRVGVVLGAIALPTESISNWAWDYLKGKPSTIDPHNLQVVALPARLAAEALGLGLGGFTLDAACASSLYALKLACDRLQSGRAIGMIAGGLSRPDSLYTQMGFAQLRSLSASGRCSPFDRKADGLVVGEGGGAFALKLLRNVDPSRENIYGVIRGVALSNDIAGNLLAPASEGQLRALRPAYEMAGWRPQQVDLIECHATGTPVGDAVEFASLHELWQGERAKPGQCVIGGVKSNVGHLLTGANAAGLMKVLFAFRDAKLPPTANFESANSQLAYESGPFRVLSQAESWPEPADNRARRAAISGFGFGGVNAHLLVEEFRKPSRHAVFAPRSDPKLNFESIAVVGLAARFGSHTDPRAIARHLLGFESLPTAIRDGHNGPWLEELDFDLERFRIPPKELEETLPQQLVMLQTADAALQDASLGREDRRLHDARFGAVVGVNLDSNTTNFHLRWQALANGDAEPETLSPPLTANRTMGALASIAASRVARAFELGGPCFTVSEEENSGSRALQIAIEMLRNQEIDRALVGTVDLGGDFRSLPGFAKDREVVEGSIAFVLKRRSDAMQDGDRIYALLEDVETVKGAAGNPELKISYSISESTPDGAESLATTGIRTLTSQPQYGVNSGLAGLLQAVLSLHYRLLPGLLSPRGQPAYWLHDSVTGPREIAVATQTRSGAGLRFTPREADMAVTGLDSPGEFPFLFEADRLEELLVRLGEIEDRLSEAVDPFLFARGLQEQLVGTGKVRLALTARNSRELGDLLRYVQGLSTKPEGTLSGPEDQASRDRVFFSANPLADGGEIAFVYPGSGNHFDGMAVEFSTLFPELLEFKQRGNRLLRSQFAANSVWQGSCAEATPRDLIFAQVSVGALTAAVAEHFGISPKAVLGYSLGESAGLFASRVWRARDEMFERMRNSTLFVSDLAPPYNSARKFWNFDAKQTIDWLTCLVASPPDAVRGAIGSNPCVFLCIINTPRECVVAGLREEVQKVLQVLGVSFIPIQGVTTAHCEVTRPVAERYRQLHRLPIHARPGVRFYSTAWGQAYEVDTFSAAETITDALLHTLDFPRIIETAYRDGVRIFVEMAPGNSCTRMVGAILGERAHLVRSICPARKDNRDSLVRLLANLWVEGVPIDWSALWPKYPQPEKIDPKAMLKLKVHEKPIVRPLHKEKVAAPVMPVPVKPAPVMPNPVMPTPVMPARALQGQRFSTPNLFAGHVAVLSEATQAHNSFLRIGAGTQRALSQILEFQNRLIQREWPSGSTGLLQVTLPTVPQLPRLTDASTLAIVQDQGAYAPRSPETEVPRSLNFEQCTEFAVGQVGRVLGPRYAEIDSFPTRVRLPEGPLMLVDRMLQIEGEPLSLRQGRVVTEHDIYPGRWYLDSGRIPVSIAVEAGQADLFLSGFLGIDLRTRGLAVYRLLDAVVTFHRSLPKVGETIRYDIHIDSFFRQSETYLFRFRFVGSVNGEKILTMTEGCAGFFTSEELAAGKGIIQTDLDRRPLPGRKPKKRYIFAASNPESLSSSQVEALRHGDLVTAFGKEFQRAHLTKPAALPTGKLKLVDRVVSIEPAGGRYELGRVRAEMDIHPDDWFLVCHFVDDQVMPGTLMYECCLHTLRIYLMGIGWVGEEGEVICEPVPGTASRLKCRGQVISTTKVVRYEVTLKEIGFRPEPYVIGDALMYADGKPIVEITNLSLRMSGLTHEKLEAVWNVAETKLAYPERKPAIFDTDRITAFAIGNPSEAFGEPYRVFDTERVIARLPGPPYQFLDRITAIQADPWKLQAGGEIEAQYDVPPDEWYFWENNCWRMPFSVLLEVALQPCGWLAAYLGSALTSPVDLSFRNLGGNGIQHAEVGPKIGTLTTKVKITKVSQSAGMIIQNYEYTVHSGGRLIYSGDTYFGFFTKAALSNQLGMPNAPWFQWAQETAQWTGYLPREAPFPGSILRMVDSIDYYSDAGGPHGLGLIEGSIEVLPSFWFFKAHFHQDPVWPGSLGLEAFLQLLKFYAWKKFGDPGAAGWQSMALEQKHAWTYRGQIIPGDGRVTVQVLPSRIDSEKKIIWADGFLKVDGRIIYEMRDFSIQP